MPMIHDETTTNLTKYANFESTLTRINTMLTPIFMYVEVSFPFPFTSIVQTGPAF